MNKWIDNPQEIANRNAGKAAEAMEIAGITNEVLIRHIKKLIYRTADDIKLFYGEGTEAGGNE